MAVHAQQHVTESTESQVIQKSASHEVLPVRLQELERIAKKKYSPYLDLATRFDDAQDAFSSKMTNFMKGCRLTTKVALLAAALAEKNS
jgi:hypothetical protein